MDKQKWKQLKMAETETDDILLLEAPGDSPDICLNRRTMFFLPIFDETADRVF